MREKPRIKVTENGPYLVTGTIQLYEYTITYDKDGFSRDYKNIKRYKVDENYALCRCGNSKNKPFCDGTHKKIPFDGLETAKKASYISCAKTIEGPELNLTDYPELCSYARFCDANGTAWRLVKKTADPITKKEFIRQCQHCPSGRLVAWNKKTGKPIEENLEPSIVLIQDPYMDCAGPIWVRGGVIIGSVDETDYEVRNRVTLCRCGHSQNKPFCDGTHASIKFKS